MSEPIKAGDLVQVVRGNRCCGYAADDIGKITVVASLRSSTAGECFKCGQLQGEDGAIAVTAAGDFFVWKLRRIPPLEELEGHITEEENFVKALPPE